MESRPNPPKATSNPSSAKPETVAVAKELAKPSTPAKPTAPLPAKSATGKPSLFALLLSFAIALYGLTVLGSLIW